ncbi:hypothetical protein [Corynebacterium liangguodongii]|uniref:Uncharacterized protein n=1 Tax=Corynebacterium liangguodongii TaxID=2079535 RepID=A0A2S0WBX2_9CORY|nr:hypothetical protein [Corynebacterium liangguodongii]AWB83265.1 hypothetical protein C3E79_01175 [Corynebacterium liangguodongii]PWC00645.1 hypothetical protein DF219_01775 [Corynebacterium liangguodongii]
MAHTHESVADIRSESFPQYQQSIEDSYIDGYEPVSLSAPHSSLNTHAMWVAMGLILAALFGIGLSVWGAGALVVGMGSEPNIGAKLLTLGLIEVAVTLIGAAVLMTIGRRNYRAYRKRTGRVN